MDESILRNLDTQHRQLRDAENTLEALLHGDAPAVPVTAPAPGEDAGRSYEALTSRNDALRVDRGWAEVDLDAALGPEQRQAFDRWRARQRLPWTASDLAVVGLAGVLGLAVTVYDTAVDAQVRTALGRLKNTEPFKAAEKAGRRLAIDHTGPGFGGPAHRVRSAGHDLARPFAALRQIRSGTFEGVRWADGVSIAEIRSGAGRPVEDLAEAIAAWAQHLAADIVTPLSLPLPGWTLLYELPWRDARKFAHDAYAGTAWGDGLNARSGLISASLPVISTEIIVRTHIHGRAWTATGSARLDDAQRGLRTELLLASHALVGAAALGKTIAAALTGPTGPLAIAGPAVAVRHLNLPVLLKVGQLAIQVAHDTRARHRAAAPPWGDLLAGVAQPWQLDEAAALEDTARQREGLDLDLPAPAPADPMLDR